MADIAITAADVGRLYPQNDEVYSFIATEAITRGQAVYQLTTGKVGVADANVAGKQQFRGIALNAASAGEPVDVIIRGYVGGFTVASLNSDALLYLSDTAGALADSAGTMTVQVGRVMGTAGLDSSGNVIEEVYVDAHMHQTWS